jgi:hypothetical protein
VRPRIDRSTVSPAEARHLDQIAEHAAFRREQNRAAGACINENKSGTHGSATDGVRCAACAAKRRNRR